MEDIVVDRPTLQPEKVAIENVSSGLDAIAAKMAAMKEQTLRNQPAVTNPTETGSSQAAAKESPVAPEGTEVLTDSNTDSISEPEVAVPEDEYIDDNEEVVAPEEVQVSETDSSEADIIDFLEFADSHPNAKFKFKRNGKEIEIDAKKAASILGQGAAISEDARQLKIERAEFDEYLQNKRAETDGLLLAMEFTVKPQLQKAYDEIVKTQGYQTTFQQQLAQTQDPAQRARIQASIQQNERYITQMGQTINQLKPNLDEFKRIRSLQAVQVLENNRKSFKDKELKNEYIFNEIREKAAKVWKGANDELLPGIKNIDLHVTQCCIALLAVALIRLQHGIKENLSSVAYLT